MSRIFWDNDALPIGTTAAKLVYDLRRDDAGENLLCETPRLFQFVIFCGVTS